MKYALVEGKKTHIKDAVRGQIGLDCWHKEYQVKACKGHYMQYWKYTDAKPSLPEGYENETEWHAAWKSSIFDECCEVVCGPESEHRADIKTDDYVIELQYSSISYDAVKERTKFYKDITNKRVIWIVNAFAAERKGYILRELDSASKGTRFIVKWKYQKKWVVDICGSKDTSVFLDISPTAKNLIFLWKHDDILYGEWMSKEEFYNAYLKNVSKGYDCFSKALKSVNKYDYK